MMKRITALALAVCVLLLSLPAFAAEPDGQQAASYGNAIQMLDSLGLLDGSIADSAAPGDAITRAEVASLLLAITGYDNITGGEKRFSDVPDSHWAAGRINAACDLGYINGYDDGAFHPDSPVTGGELVKMLVHVLGYDELARRQGGWPTGYLLEGGKLGILSNTDIGQDSPVTYGQAAQAIYNALNVDILRPVSYGGTVRYESTEDQTLLTERLNLYKVKGTVRAVGKTAVKPGEEVREGWVRVDDYIYQTGELDLYDYIGMRVEFYYLDTEDDDPVVRTMYLARNASAVTAQAGDINTVTAAGDGWTVSYDSEDSENEDVTLSRYADVIYNGRADPDFDVNRLSGLQEGTV